MFKSKNFIHIELIGDKTLIESSFSDNASSDEILKLINIAGDKDEIIKSLANFAERKGCSDKLKSALKSMPCPDCEHQNVRMRNPLIRPCHVLKAFAANLKD